MNIQKQKLRLKIIVLAISITACFGMILYIVFSI